MDVDDIVYLLILISSIGFGRVFRNISDMNKRKNVATIVGLVIVFLASGRHIFHHLFTVFVNFCFIKCLSKKVVHIWSFAFTFLYLLFFRMAGYFGIPYPPGHTNLIQMILTLKLVGLAYEVHDSAVSDNIDCPSAEASATRVKPPRALDMLHYSFCYIGVLTGPYFSYRTYCDLFDTPFSKYAPCEKVTIERLKMLPLYAIGFLLVGYMFPLSYVQEEEFYTERSLWFRLWYIVPGFYLFRMRMYIGMRLSEGVAIMSGLGAYPAVSAPKSGKGPTKEYPVLMDIATNEQRAKMCEYNFDTVYNIEPKAAEFEKTVRSCMKYWNMSIQYWLANFVYRRFPYRALRMPVTFLISGFWHGIYAGHYMCLFSVPFYLPIEDIYVKNLRSVARSPVVERICWIIAYQWRLFLMGYWAMAFMLLHVQPAVRYWSSIYFIPTLITIAMLVVAKVIFPKPSHRSPERAKTK